MSRLTMPLFIFALLFTAVSATAADQPVSESPSSETIAIVAQGMGTDADSALRNAYNNAIQQALGLYVDAETLVQNDQLVKDQVLTHSRGLIKEVATVSQSNENGIFNVTIRAQVLRQPLIDKVTPILKTTVAVDGTSLHAASATKEKQVKDAQALLDEAIKPLMGPGLFNFEFDGEPKFDEKDGSKLIVTIKATPNLELYNKLKKEFIAVLEQIATNKTEYSKVFENELLKLTEIAGEDSNANGEGKVIFVNMWKSKNRLQSKWARYEIPALCSNQKNLVNVTTEVSILDGNGELLALGSSHLRIVSFSMFNFLSKNTCIFSPDIVLNRYMNAETFGIFDSNNIESNNILRLSLYGVETELSPDVSYKIPISVDASILADMKSMKIEVK